jgi:uncharacterized membrane protein YbhN (UPF0104 family)
MKTLTNRFGLQLIGGVLVGAACLWLSLRDIAPGQMAAQMARVSWPLVIAAAAGVVLISVGKAFRWTWLYPPDAPPLSVGAHFGVLVIAQMLNLAVAVRLGELARLGLMRQEGRPLGMTLGTIAVEKSLDLLAVGLLLLLSAPLALLPIWLRPRAAPSAFLTGAGLLALLLLVGKAQPWLLRLLTTLPAPRRQPWARLWGYLLRLVQATLAGIAGVEGKRLLPVLICTAAVWLLSAGVIQLMLWAFGIAGGWRVAMVLMLALTFSNLVPSPPALIGVVGAITVGLLTPLGVPTVTAVAMGTLLNVVMVAPLMLLGGWAVGVRLLRLLAPGGTAAGRGVAWRQALGLVGPNDRRGER